MGVSIADWFERLTPLRVAILLAVVAELLFAIHLGQPNKMMFDETYYVPAARETFGLAGRSNEEHPLLAKWLIGLSMALFGDTPAGWRALGTVAGTATVVAIFAIALRLFGGDIRAAATAAVLAMLNQMLFIQARIAMLDGYAAAFLLSAIALMAWGLTAKAHAGRHLLGAGVCLGLAAGCKWSALPYVALAGILLLAVRWTRGAPQAWPRVSTMRGAAYLGFGSIAAYFATFAPALFYANRPIRLDELVGYQAEMYALQTRPLAPHTYMSDWWQWPLITRPIWYLYEAVDGVQRGVLLVGNPAIMWGGMIALLACLWAGLRDRARPLLIAAGLYLFSFGIWVVIPKKIGFYYYYYLPGLFLTIVLAGAIQHYWSGASDRWKPAGFLLLSLGVFGYFYPIISAAALPGDQAFLHWMWLSTWP